MTKLTLEQIKRAAPMARRSTLNQHHVDLINKACHGDIAGDAYKENILGYLSVLGDGRYKIADYLDAVKYVSYKLLGDSNISAYTKTFPKRYQRLIDKGIPTKNVAGFVSAYNKNQLVNKILEQSMIPTHIINADIHQQAINHLAYLMLNAKSEKVQSDSAGKLVDVLKIPETTKIELDIGLKENDAIKELRTSTLALVEQQKLMLKAGVMNAQEVAHSKITAEVIDAEVVEE